MSTNAQPNHEQQHDSGLDPAKPVYGATIGQAFVRFWRKYFDFTGRASRSEFWWWTLINAVIVFALTVAEDSITERVTIASAIWTIGTAIGTIALAVRRLHDTNRRGWWYFMVFIPVVGSIILLVLCALPSDPAGARFNRSS